MSRTRSADGRPTRCLLLAWILAGSPACAPVEAPEPDPEDRIEPATPEEPDPNVLTVQGLSFSRLPPGTFTMGCVPGRDDLTGDCWEAEQPAHEVSLSRPLWFARTEVTQGQFEALMGYNPALFPACGADCPMENTTWGEAAGFANALSALDGLDACYSCAGERADLSCAPLGDPYACAGYRLATEAEWEYAARGGEDFEFAGSSDPDDVAWYFDSGGDDTTYPVGTRSPNAFELYDMTGNVWEWVEDRFAWYPDGPVTDPFQLDSPIPPAQRIKRGGSWGTYPVGLRVSVRHIVPSDQQGWGLGIRLVRSIDG